MSTNRRFGVMKIWGLKIWGQVLQSHIAPRACAVCLTLDQTLRDSAWKATETGEALRSERWHPEIPVGREAREPSGLGLFTV